MKVALVHDYLNQFGGGERVLLSLMKMFPDAPVYTLMYSPQLSCHSGVLIRNPVNPERIKQTSFLDFPFARKHHRLFIPLMPLAAQSLNLGGEYDLIISDSHGFSKGITYDRTKTKHISYIHTPLRYAWECAHYFGNSWYAKLFAFIFAPAFAYLRYFDYKAAQKPDILLANSRYIAAKIKKYYHRSVTVVYPPIHVSEVPLPTYVGSGTSYSGNYYLSVGRFLEYKRFDLIIEACLKGNFNLKIVGAGRLEEQLKKMAHHSPCIEFLPFQSDENLQKLYAGAKAFIMANEEDFGMVMAEAQSCGTPVIAYGRGGALEIVNDPSVIASEARQSSPTGVLFSDQTPESLVKAIQHFETLTFDRTAIRLSAERFSEARFMDDLQKSINLLK